MSSEAMADADRPPFFIWAQCAHSKEKMHLGAKCHRTDGAQIIKRKRKNVFKSKLYCGQKMLFVFVTL